MPIVNTYFSSDKQKDMVLGHIQDLKELIAKQLTRNDIQLKIKEITVRLLWAPSEGMIADIELEIFAHAFDEREEKQDDICIFIRNHIMKNVPELNDVRVWLILSELGHS